MTPHALVLSMLALALTACAPEPETVRTPGATVKGERLTLGEPEKAAAFLSSAPVGAGEGDELRLPGRLVWNEERTVRIVPPLPGRVTRILAEPGRRVAAGATLALISSAEFGQAHAEWRKAESDARLATQAYARASELKAAGVIAEREWQQAEAEHARARAEAGRAVARMRALGGARGEAQTYALTTPIAGVVVERNLNPGQEVRPEAPPPFVVTDPASLWVQLDASEADLAHLRPGQPLAIEARQYPGIRFAGEIAHVADFVDPQSRTIKVRGKVANPDRRLKGEMFVTASIALPPGTHPRLPSPAVFLIGAERYVFVEEAPGRYERRRVRLGAEHDGRVEVLSGVAVGERVVTEGSLHLLRYFKAPPGGAT